MNTINKILSLKKISNDLRIKVLETAKKTGGKGSHLGGTFSAIEILVALYYGRILKFNSKKPLWKDRDRLLIGKGHIHLAMYHIWNDLGFITKKLINSYGKNGSRLGQQLNNTIPGSEYNTGSLGHVIGLGAGICLAAKMDKKKFKTIALVGDAECDEGSIWEAVMFAGKNKLNNLITIVDRNRMSVMEYREDDNNSGKLENKFKSCGWDVKVINGHSIKDIFNTFKKIKNSSKPVVILADTIKGKGVSFMEKNIKWHSGIPSNLEYSLAVNELKNNYEKKN